MQILVAVDPNDIAFTTLLQTAARVRGKGDSLHVLHVLHVPITWRTDPYEPEERRTESPREEAREKIVQALARHHLHDAEVEIKLGADSNPGNDIVEAAVRVGASLIMIATHGRIWRGLFMGSVAERVLRHADCDVYVVRAPRG